MQVNNKYMYDYDELKKSTCMYGYALLQLLLYGGYEFVEYWSMITFDFNKNYNKENKIGYVLMVDVDYSVYL